VEVRGDGTCFHNETFFRLVIANGGVSAPINWRARARDHRRIAKRLEAQVTSSPDSKTTQDAIDRNLDYADAYELLAEMIEKRRPTVAS